MTIKDYFDRVYIINLPERTDRRRDMTKELKRARLQLESGKVEMFAAIRPSGPAGFQHAGVRGCFLSHYTIIKLARDQRLNNVLIMEDDLVISPRFNDRNLVEQLRARDWGFVYFGHVLGLEDNVPSTLRPHTGGLRTTHFLAIGGAVFDRLLYFLDLVQARPAGHPDGGPMPVDGAYSTFRQQNQDVLTLIADPNLGWQRSSKSDLTPRWFDRLPGFQQLAGVGRRLKVLVKGR